MSTSVAPTSLIHQRGTIGRVVLPSSLVDRLLSELRPILAAVHTDDGLVSGSVYDSAQVLRFAPPHDPQPVIDWVLRRQHADGGWETPTVPLARTVPTLAAVLALVPYQQQPAVRAATTGAAAFLQQHVGAWSRPLPEDIPVGTELIAPRLLADAAAAYQIPTEPFATLNALGDHRRRLLQRLPLRPGGPAVHSWEAWGEEATTAFIDGTGSIGHSPSATAAWLHLAADQPDLAVAKVGAEDYLRRAARATPDQIPGVVPTIWPYPRNEQTLCLYAVLVAGMLDHPGLADVVAVQVRDMVGGIRAEGQGLSDHFAVDGDSTSMVCAVATAAGYPVSSSLIRRYLVEGTCLSYPHELQRSISATAHAAHALALLDDDPAEVVAALEQVRAPNGSWTGDKWHASAGYLTSHAIVALLEAGQPQAALTALPVLLAQQAADGTWGGTTDAVTEETAYGALGLLAYHRHDCLPPAGQVALERAACWLIDRFDTGRVDSGSYWIGKELYRPIRISRVIELSITLACVEAGFGGAA